MKQQQIGYYLLPTLYNSGICRDYFEFNICVSFYKLIFGLAKTICQHFETALYCNGTN